MDFKLYEIGGVFVVEILACAMQSQKGTLDMYSKDTSMLQCCWTSFEIRYKMNSSIDNWQVVRATCHDGSG